jgi:serine O-acetyltransferase
MAHTLPAQQNNKQVTLDRSIDGGQQPSQIALRSCDDYLSCFNNLNFDVMNKIRQDVIDVIVSYLPFNQVAELIHNRTIDKIVQHIGEDLVALVARDPAAGNNPMAVLNCYLSLKAVAHYRIANALYKFTPSIDGSITQLQIVARQISESAKVITGIEIHPAATIGRWFTIDHGLGTVIGETTIIGDRAYILQSVILGGAKIAGNQLGQRHPIIGSGVQIGAFARVFGAITVGDNVVICPHAVITEDIPADSRVIVRTTNQIVKKQSH